MLTTPPKPDSCEDGSRRECPVQIRFGSFRIQIAPPSRSLKALLCIFLIPMLFLGQWFLSHGSRLWSRAASDMSSVRQSNLDEYFQTFSGSTECGINLPDLYLPPKKDDRGAFPRGSFCPNRERLLEAMTGGGRHGFNAPYFPKGCHYRWYSVEEICMILERFDALVFIGDDGLHTIYNGLNILLRRDLALGTLDSSQLSSEELKTCRCENQFIKDTCSKHSLTSSEQVGPQVRNPYSCSRTPHAFLPVFGSPFPPRTLKSLTSLIPHAPPSNYHPIPIITSLTPSSSSSSSSSSGKPPPTTALATQTLSDLLSFADATSRKTPILWVGPTAAGHLDIGGGQVGNNHLWMFSGEMERAARERDVESLGVWNMTVQAESWDGRRFGSRVAIVQAMMVINWLSRLESS